MALTKTIRAVVEGSPPDPGHQVVNQDLRILLEEMRSEAQEAAADAVTAAEVAQAAAEDAQTAAETAADAAAVNGAIYPNTAAGLAAVALGGYFSVPSADSLEHLILYREDAGPVATEIKRYPSSAAIADKPTAVDSGTVTAVEDAAGQQTVVEPTVWADGGRIETAGYTLEIAAERQAVEIWDSLTGQGAILGQPNADALTASASADVGYLFTAAQYAYAEAEALTEAARLSAQDVSGFARRDVAAAAGKVLRITTGQSFAAGSAQGNPYLTASRLAMLGYSGLPAQAVGPETRGVSAGATFVTYGGGSTTLTTIADRMTAPTGTDSIYSEADIATGNYAVNARGATPETARELIQWILSNRYGGRADTAARSWQTVNLNHAKTDGLLSELATGDGWSRLQSLVDVYWAATTGTRLCDAVCMVHGQADEAAATATYAADLASFYAAIVADVQAQTSQSAAPVMVMSQVGGPRYGTAAMVCADAQVDVMLDLTGSEAGIFVVGTDYELPSPYFFDNSEFTGFPTDALWDNNGHPFAMGVQLIGLRQGIALHYLLDRQEAFWSPFPYRVYYSGRNFLLSVPSKFPPLRATEMVCGVETYLLDNLGLTFESGGGTDNPVEWARVVPGYKTLIEGRCTGDISTSTVFKAGKRTGALHVSGFTNIRDSFDLTLPWQYTFLSALAAFPGSLRDNPRLNGLGRYMQDIPGWVGQPDLGMPMLRRTLTATAIPL